MSGRKRIGNVAAVLLILVAVLFDGLQILIDLLAPLPLIGIPLAFVLGIIADICAIILFGMWFSVLNVSLMTRYPFGFLGTIVLENIPIVNTAPGWTWFVVRTIAQERARASSSADDEV